MAVQIVSYLSCFIVVCPWLWWWLLLIYIAHRNMRSTKVYMDCPCGKFLFLLQIAETVFHNSNTVKVKVLPKQGIILGIFYEHFLQALGEVYSVNNRLVFSGYLICYLHCRVPLTYFLLKVPVHMHLYM